MATLGPTTQSYLDQAAGDLLRLARSQRAWSQRRLADAAGVLVSTVARIESGTRRPSLLTLFRLLATADRELRFDDHDDVLDERQMTSPRPRAAHRHAGEHHMSGSADHLPPNTQAGPGRAGEPEVSPVALESVRPASSRGVRQAYSSLAQQYTVLLESMEVVQLEDLQLIE